MKYVLLVAVAVGCHSSATLGTPCGPRVPCEDGEVCNYSADEPTCIPADGDIDGDGIPNAEDFCNDRPGGAHDEDGDGIGDECDRCPIAPPRATPDPDGDMVDAPCDPDPNEPGDEILLFDGFATGLDPRWLPTTASAWTWVPGEVIVKLDNLDSQEYLRTNVVGKDSIAIEASYRVDRVESSATQHLVGVRAADPRPAGVAQVQCYVTGSSVSPDELVVVETNQGAMNDTAMGAFDSANLYRVATYVTGTRAGCSVLSNNQPLGVLQTSITADQLSVVSLTARATTVRFQYVLVVGR